MPEVPCAAALVDARWGGSDRARSLLVVWPRQDVKGRRDGDRAVAAMEADIVPELAGADGTRTSSSGAKESSRRPGDVGAGKRCARPFIGEAVAVADAAKEACSSTDAPSATESVTGVAELCPAWVVCVGATAGPPKTARAI